MFYLILTYVINHEDHFVGKDGLIDHLYFIIVINPQINLNLIAFDISWNKWFSYSLAQVSYKFESDLPIHYKYCYFLCVCVNFIYLALFCFYGNFVSWSLLLSDFLINSESFRNSSRL